MALSPKMTHRRLISISGGCIPKIGPRSNKLTRRLCLEKLILRQIFGLFIQTERSKTPAVSAIPSWTNAATSWNLSGPSIDVTEHYRARADLEKAFEEIKRLRDQLYDENVVLREQIDQAFMFCKGVGTGDGT